MVLVRPRRDNEVKISLVPCMLVAFTSVNYLWNMIIYVFDIKTLNVKELSLCEAWLLRYMHIRYIKTYYKKYTCNLKSIRNLLNNEPSAIRFSCLH